MRTQLIDKQILSGRIFCIVFLTVALSFPRGYCCIKHVKETEQRSRTISHIIIGINRDTRWPFQFIVPRGLIELEITPFDFKLPRARQPKMGQPLVIYKNRPDDISDATCYGYEHRIVRSIDS